MKLNRVLVVYKSRTDTTLDAIVHVLRRLHLPHRLINREKLRRGPRASLMVTVGGDGTVLSSAHAAESIPILGVNSRPGKSVGFYCAATRATFPRLLRRILQGSWKPTRLPLLDVRIDAKRLPFYALNDILVASTVPSELVSYRLRAGTKAERQRGSGLWICAGPGTTAGYRSAGGKPAAITSTTLRFLVREPCPLPGERYRLLRGKVPHGQMIAVTMESQETIICLDGPSLVTRLKAGEVLTVKVARQPVFLYL